MSGQPHPGRGETDAASSARGGDGSGAGPGMVLVISGPSGVGKTTVTHALRERIPDAVFSVSATTRPKSEKEIHGQDYFFLTQDQFNKWVEDGEFLEHAIYAGNRYGTPRRPVIERVRAGSVIILDIDVQGGAQVKQEMPESFSIFILPPGEDALLERLRRRAREGEDQIQRRFNEARREIAEAKASDAYDLFVVNDDLELTIETLLQRVQQERDKRRAAAT